VPAERPRILCGDFNSPYIERADGTVEVHGNSERWRSAERSVILGLGEHDLPDVFRSLHGYGATDASLVREGGQWRRRFDHAFASVDLRPLACRYHHVWREPSAGTRALSDHSAIETDFAPGVV
jgi:hypothetical protein